MGISDSVEMRYVKGIMEIISSCKISRNGQMVTLAGVIIHTSIK